MLVRFNNALNKPIDASYGGKAYFYCMQGDLWLGGCQGRIFLHRLLTAIESRQYFHNVVNHHKFIILMEEPLTKEASARIIQVWPDGWVINLNEPYIKDVIKQCELSSNEFIKLIGYDLLLGLTSNGKIYLI